jgi:hypothetical protein
MIADRLAVGLVRLSRLLRCHDRLKMDWRGEREEFFCS